MKKIETIWHHLLNSAIEQANYKHTQQELAHRFGYSISTVNYALKNPENIGAIRKESKFFILQDFQKLLYYWASLRNLESDIIYKTQVSSSVFEIEGLVPPQAVYGCYSAVRHQFTEPPADYDKVFFYLSHNNLLDVQRRFPLNKKNPANVFVLKMPEKFKVNHGTTTLPQTFVDIWNLRDWYAHDFCKFLEEKMHGLLS